MPSGNHAHEWKYNEVKVVTTVPSGEKTFTVVRLCTSCLEVEEIGLKAITKEEPLVANSNLRAKKFYLTKQASSKHWHYVGDPLNPHTTMDVGLIEVDRSEIIVDQYGSYVVKLIPV